MMLWICLCVVLAGVFIYHEHKKKYVLAVILKGLASLCFVMLGRKLSDGSRIADLIVTGLMVGCVADILLNLRYVFGKRGKLIFLIGILVFLSGHIIYLAAIWPLNDNPQACVIVSLILTAVLMKWIFKRIEAPKAFKIFGIFYIGAIVMMNCFAIYNLISDPSQPFQCAFAFGAILFLISDIVLILNTFGPRSKFSLRVTNLSLYYAGQLLIALSLMYLKNLMV